MGKLILVTGGARSGKSTYAEKLVKEHGNEVMYIATSIPFDDEMKDRVRKHRERRPDNWHTFEGYSDLKKVYDNHDSFQVILLDCVTVMITNLLFEKAGEDFDSLDSNKINIIEKNIMDEVEDFISAVKRNPETAVLVTNELGSGIVPEYKSGRVFRDIAGRVNQYIASMADEVYIAISGIPLKLK